MPITLPSGFNRRTKVELDVIEDERGNPVGFTGGCDEERMFQTQIVQADSSRALTSADLENLVYAGSGVTLTLPSDAALGISAGSKYAAGFAFYAAGASAYTLDTTGRTMVGTAPTVSQYGVYGIVRVAANTWAYL